MTDAYKTDEDGKTAAFNLTRLPATTEVILPPDDKRRSLIAAAFGVLGFALAAALFLLALDFGKAPFVPKWQASVLFGVAIILAFMGLMAFVFAKYELSDMGQRLKSRRRLMTIGDTYVEVTNWPIIGFRKFNHVPLTDYAGVMKQYRDLGKLGVYYAVWLFHENPRLGVLLCLTESPAVWDEKWRYYADKLRLPAIDEGYRPKDAKVDGTPAMKVLPGARFTLDVDDLPAAAVFDVRSGARFVGFLFGLGTIGLSGASLWESCRPTSCLPENVEQVLLSLMLPLFGLYYGFYFAARSHLAYRTVLVDRGHVTGTRRRLSGMERWVEPISAFRGVRGSACKESVYEGRTEKAMRYTITLVHPDRHKSAILYRAAYQDDLASKLQYYADRLGVPILDGESG